jgi:hypothetical protein
MARPPAGHSARRCDQFAGDFEWASNFHQHPLVFEDIEYPSSEHAFQAAKTLDQQLRLKIAAAPTPGASKGAGRRVQLRPGWDQRVRFEQMAAVLRSKFEDPGLRQRLLATADMLLVEGNRHCDQVWGCCHCDRHAAWPGRNELGQALMRLRAQLAGEPPDLLRRVACTGHREQHLNDEQIAWMHQELQRVAVKLRQHHGMQVAIHGGANGADLAWAQAAVRAEVDELWAYVPFEAQADRFNPSQRQQWEAYTRLRSDGGYADLRWCFAADYDVRLLHARNDAMIRDADAFVAVVDPAKTTGGTASALQKLARGRVDGSRVPIIRLDVAARRTTWQRASTTI